MWNWWKWQDCVAPLSPLDTVNSVLVSPWEHVFQHLPQIAAGPATCFQLTQGRGIWFRQTESCMAGLRVFPTRVILTFWSEERKGWKRGRGARAQAQTEGQTFSRWWEAPGQLWPGLGEGSGRARCPLLSQYWLPGALTGGHPDQQQRLLPDGGSLGKGSGCQQDRGGATATQQREASPRE